MASCLLGWLASWLGHWAAGLAGLHHSDGVDCMICSSFFFWRKSNDWLKYSVSVGCLNPVCLLPSRCETLSSFVFFVVLWRLMSCSRVPSPLWQACVRVTCAVQAAYGCAWGIWSWVLWCSWQHAWVLWCSWPTVCPMFWIHEILVHLFLRVVTFFVELPACTLPASRRLWHFIHSFSSRNCIKKQPTEIEQRFL